MNKFKEKSSIYRGFSNNYKEPYKSRFDRPNYRK